MVNLKRFKQWFHGDKKHIDEQKIEQRKADLKALRRLMETGDLEGYKALVRELRPGISEAEMQQKIRLFYEYRAMHPSDGHYPS